MTIIKNLKILSTILVLASVLMLIYILNIYKKTGADTKVTITTKTATSTQIQANTAFIKLLDMPPTVKRNGELIIKLESNNWSKCLIDLYKPNGEVVQFADSSQAEFKSISATQREWTWKIPENAEVGQWSGRVLCGTFENLATADVVVEVSSE